MAQYIDGFAFPIDSSRLDEYKVVAKQIAKIYAEHGAVRYQEFVGDDLSREGTRAFPETLNAGEGETIVFGWITYDSKATRDQVNQKVESDPRIPELVGPLFDPNQPIFAPTKMAFGGFRALLDSD